jgi:hypothetical protein
LSGEQAEGPAPARTAAVIAFLVLLLFTVALMVFSIPAGFYAVFSGGLSNAVSYASPANPYFWVGPLPFFAGTLPIGVMFAGVMVVYVALLLLAVSQDVRPWKAAAASVRGGFESLASSPFFVMVIAVGFLTFSASIIDTLTASAGIPIGSLSGDPLQLFVGFTYAPLVEEIGFRVVMIGLVAMVLSLGKTWKEALGALWRPSKAMEGVVVGTGTAIIIWAATGLSAVTFGACHVICGGSAWQIGKFPEAAFGGLVLGYVYVRYGLHVAVITHWGIDYFGSALAFFGQAAYGIRWNSATTEYVGQYLVDYDMLFLFGLASFLLVAYLGLKKWTRRKALVVDERFIPPPAGGTAEP